MSDFSNYQSPFSWRYGSQSMRSIWSENNKRLVWRQLWVALAEAECEQGLVTPEQVEDLRSHAAQLDIQRALEMEASIKHDLMAEIKVFAEQCLVGGGIIHLGATSMDIKDNADALQIRKSLDLILDDLRDLLLVAANLVEESASIPVMAFTHLQPAEPTTLGYRFANFAQDLVEDYQALKQVRDDLRGKGFKGAVGNAASYIELMGEDKFDEFEGSISRSIGLPFFAAATQTYSRRQDFVLLSQLASLAATLSKFALDLRILQSQPIGEIAEPFGQKQVGSSAMPFKRNPINAEKIDSLARTLSAAPQIAWQNAAGSMLERTLDDSANRRTLLPESFLALDEMLATTTKILEGLVINHGAIEKTMKDYAPFAAIERILMALVKKGADRQSAHELLRACSLRAWKAISEGQSNPLVQLVSAEKEITELIPPAEIRSLMTAASYTGMAENRARQVAGHIRRQLKQ